MANQTIKSQTKYSSTQYGIMVLKYNFKTQLIKYVICAILPATEVCIKVGFLYESYK